MFIRRENFQQFIRLYPAVTLLLIINTCIFIAVKLTFLFGHTLLENMLGINIYIKEGQLWRLITPIFLHSSLFHFIFNSFSLLLFGPAIEQMLQKTRFLTFYLLCGIGANILTFFLMPPTYAHLGASGAIFGLIGFYLYLVAFQKHLLSRQDVQMIKGLAIFALIMTFLQPNVNVLAHVGGAIIGFLLASIFIKPVHR
ncbi:rhomboid family intramembrane serine protease [Bacillus sp. AGMB 02131]|uniref:Rhomboid family intramembrane serine protease n=1 Tax=Peribacillus faecalis TaxID=2772559 RepID=A0A927CZV0_9BACI|nr:rhomboid family intramembrane serine protease [Peribacillus faecalis]MBD3109692.1 rhomboid family intramembrane serine protease [Peribacillus faecalis]